MNEVVAVPPEAGTDDHDHGGDEHDADGAETHAETKAEAETQAEAEAEGSGAADQPPAAKRMRSDTMARGVPPPPPLLSSSTALLDKFQAMQRGLAHVADDATSHFNKIVKQSGGEVLGRAGTALVTSVILSGKVRYTSILPLLVKDMNESERDGIRVFTFRPVRKPNAKPSSSEFLEPVGGVGESGAFYSVPWGTTISIKEFSGSGAKLEDRFAGEIVHFRGLRFEISRYVELKEQGKPDAPEVKKIGFSFRAFMDGTRIKTHDFLRTMITSNASLTPLTVLNVDIDKNHGLQQLTRLYGDLYEMPEKVSFTRKNVVLSMEPVWDTRARIAKGETFYVANIEQAIDQKRGYTYQRASKPGEEASAVMRVVSGTHGDWDSSRCRPATFTVTQSDGKTALVASCLWPESVERFQTTTPEQWAVFGRTFIENCVGVLYGTVGMNLSEDDKSSEELDEVERTADGTYLARLMLAPRLEDIVRRIGLIVPPHKVSAYLEEHLDVRMVRNADGTRVPTTNGNLRVVQVVVNVAKDRPPTETVHMPGETAANISTLSGNIESLEEYLKEDKHFKVGEGHPDVNLYVVYPHCVLTSRDPVTGNIIEDKLDLDTIRQMPNFDDQLTAVRDIKYYPLFAGTDPAKLPFMLFIVSNRKPVSSWIKPLKHD